jgi:hypothetical protein
MSITQRIKQISDNEHIKITQLEEKVGASKGVFSRSFKNNTDIQSKWLSVLVENYPQYNTRWLLTGNGSMLETEEKIQIPNYNNSQLDLIVKLSAENALLKKENEELKLKKKYIGSNYLPFASEP